MSPNKVWGLIKLIGKLNAPRQDSLISRFLVAYSKPLAERIAALANAC